MRDLLTPLEVEAVNTALKSICVAMSDQMLELSAPLKTNVKKEDGSFASKIAPNDISYTLAYSYIGSSEVIFGFEPEDAQPWAFFEIGERKLDKAMPLLAAEICTTMKMPVEESLPKLMTTFTAKAVDDAKKAAARAAEVIEANYEANPDFGAF